MGGRGNLSRGGGACVERAAASRLQQSSPLDSGPLAPAPQECRAPPILLQWPAGTHKLPACSSAIVGASRPPGSKVVADRPDQHRAPDRGVELAPACPLIEVKRQLLLRRGKFGFCPNSEAEGASQPVEMMKIHDMTFVFSDGV